MNFTATWMNFTDILLNEEAKHRKYCLTPFILISRTGRANLRFFEVRIVVTWGWKGKLLTGKQVNFWDAGNG